MNSTSYILAIAFLIFVGTSIPIRNLRTTDHLAPTVQDDSEWTRIKPNDEEFAVSLPDEPFVYSSWVSSSNLLRSLIKDEKARAYGTSADGVVYVIMSFKGYNRDRDKPDKIVDVFAEKVKDDLVSSSGHSKVSTVFDRDVSSNGFTGKQYLVSLRGVPGILRCVVTKSHVYVVEAIGANETNPSVQRFFASFALGDQTLAPPDDIATSNAQPVLPDQDTGKIFKTGEVDRKPIVILKREPVYATGAWVREIKGIVVVNTVFTASGKVTNLEVVNGLAHGLSQSAVAAAREILFIPALKDGKPVSTHVRIEYSFQS